MAKQVHLDWMRWKNAASPLPGVEAHSAFMPYARTSAKEARRTGRPGVDFREAAVFLGLEADGRMVLIERTPYEGVHGGQMALPGGAREEGEGMLECALRECREELGLPAHWMPDAEPVPLTEVHVVPSGFVVQPFLAPVSLPDSLSPDPIEVAHAHRLCLHELLDLGRRVEDKVQVGGGAKPFFITAPGWRFSDLPFVWGATAMMLGELASILSNWRENHGV